MNQLLAILSRSPIWAIAEKAAAQVIACATHPAIAGIRADMLPSGEWEAAAPSMRTSPNGRGKIAVIPIQGVLTKDGPRWLGSNYDTIADAADAAVSDSDVKRIVLAIDSPGGEVTGLPELADMIHAAALEKPVSAIVEGQALSAAYWLASQARDITVTPSGMVGSVGVRMMHADLSQMLEKQGVKVTELYSGAYKTEWSPFKPLSEDAIGAMQPRLEAQHRQFIQAVSEGRGSRATADAAKARFGEGRTLSAKDALSQGMVDSIQSPRAFYKALNPAQEQESTAPVPAFPRAHASMAEARRRLAALKV